MLLRAGLVRRHVAALVTGVLSVALLVGGALIAGTAARAAFIDVPPTGQPGRLSLGSDPYPAQFLELSPGDPSYWQVAVRLEDASSATLSLELRKDGALVAHPRGLQMAVAECDVPWTGFDGVPACAGVSAAVSVATPAEDYASSSPTFPLRPLAASEPTYLLVTLSVEDSDAARADASLMGLTGTMGVGLTAVHAAPPTVGGGVLPSTGDDVALGVAVMAMAVGLLGIGAALRMRPHRRER